jgi:formate-dependent nitrite reductase membrane component NrfD
MTRPRHTWPRVRGWLRSDAGPPSLAPREEPPATAAAREAAWVEERAGRGIEPAVGTPGGPASYRPGAADADVALAQPAWEDARWSYLYGADTAYASETPVPGEIAQAARRMRGGAPASDVYGPMMKAPVWTWEVPLYFWFGGMASGSAFVGLACDVVGDERSAAIARKVALGALVPCPVLLISDLGRPKRFVAMLRIVKPRSPMSMGTWCLTAFGNVMGAAVAADVAGRRRAARALGAASAVVGGYLGSYTGVLLATTAVPVWARSRVFLGPIFVATATATGAAATRLTLAATGLPPRATASIALGNVEAGAMLAELALSSVNERRLGRLAAALHEGSPGRLFGAAKLAAAAGLALKALHPVTGRHGQNAASILYLAAALAFRFAWVGAGRASAADDEAVALTARRRQPS